MGAGQSNQAKIVSIAGRKPQQETGMHYFEPTYKMAWLIGIEKYENVKSTIDGTHPYPNVTQAKQDIETMKNVFYLLKFDEILVTQDADCLKEMADGVSKIYDKVKDGKDGKTKVLLVVYYSGHGVMKNT